jgi:hypothetical protein
LLSNVYNRSVLNVPCPATDPFWKFNPGIYYKVCFCIAPYKNSTLRTEMLYRFPTSSRLVLNVVIDALHPKGYFYFLQKMVVSKNTRISSLYIFSVGWFSIDWHIKSNETTTSWLKTIERFHCKDKMPKI